MIRRAEEEWFMRVLRVFFRLKFLEGTFSVLLSSSGETFFGSGQSWKISMVGFRFDGFRFECMDATNDKVLKLWIMATIWLKQNSTDSLLKLVKTKRASAA